MGVSGVFEASRLTAGADLRIARMLEEDEGEVLGDLQGAAWLSFWLVFVCCAILDMVCLAPKGTQTLTGRQSLLHVCLWFTIGLIFNVGVLAALGLDVAVEWFNGYILEFLLSMDNVFFFHVVFTAYATPEGQIYKGLFLGVLGAVVLRLLFYLVGAEFFRLAFLVQIFFGLLLIYSGYKTATGDEDDDDPRENTCVKLITRILPLTESYDAKGRLFKRVRPQSTSMCTLKLDSEVVNAKDAEGGPEGGLEGGGAADDVPKGDERTVVRGTLLLLVVVVLQVVDIVFAVDSVTAKIAQYDNIWVNFSSSAFAMLCLRSMYYVLTRLLSYFRFLKYGVACILVMIGIKLIISPWVELSSMFSMIMICGAFALSMLLSAVFPEKDYKGMEEAEAPEEGTCKVVEPEMIGKPLEFQEIEIQKAVS